MPHRGPVTELSARGRRAVAGLPPVDKRLLNLHPPKRKNYVNHQFPQSVVVTYILLKGLVVKGVAVRMETAKMILLCVDSYIKFGYIRAINLVCPGTNTKRAYYNIMNLAHHGNLIKVDRGIFIPSESSIELYIYAHNEYYNLLSQPMRWRL